MLLLALDTCDARGSLAAMRDETVLSVSRHESSEDYSAWLLPAVERTLSAAGVGLPEVELFAAAAGPGSFTALRVGLTSVKAWSEVYGRPVVSVSRLEALARQARQPGPFVAAFVDARREQLFAALFRRDESGLTLVDEEAVVTPAAFLGFVVAKAAGAGVAWGSLDPECLLRAPGWAARAALGEVVHAAEPALAPAIGMIALRRAANGDVNDALTLDANYVRRSDAEIFWKGTSH